jgi:hypothetical protein
MKICAEENQRFTQKAKALNEQPLSAFCKNFFDELVLTGSGKNSINVNFA